jgi:hypothetical protein
MTWYPAYLSDKQELVDFVNVQRPTLKKEHIFDVDVKWADTLVFSYLYQFGNIKVTYNGEVSGNTPNVPDQLNLLWAATMAYNCELLSYRGIISYNVGGIQESRAGNIATKFMRMQPMFFMGNNPQNLDHVMPFRSFKQMAQHFLDTFIKLYHDDSGVKYGQPVWAWDATSRGFAWNADLDTYMGAHDALLTGTT